MRNLLFGKCGKNNKRKKVTRRNCWIFGIIATTSSSVKVPDAPSPFRRQTASISIVQYVNCPWFLVSLRYQKKRNLHSQWFQYNRHHSDRNRKSNCAVLVNSCFGPRKDWWLEFILDRRKYTLPWLSFSYYYCCDFVHAWIIKSPIWNSFKSFLLFLGWFNVINHEFFLFLQNY